MNEKVKIIFNIKFEEKSTLDKNRQIENTKRKHCQTLEIVYFIHMVNFNNKRTARRTEKYSFFK